MKTATKVVLKPSDPDDCPFGSPAAAPNPRPERHPYRGPLPVVAGVVIGLVAGVLLAGNVPSIAGASSRVQSSIDAESGLSMYQNVPVATPPEPPENAFCSGKQVICSTTTTNRPSDTLAKLSSGFITEDSKRYQVMVSVRLCDSTLCKPQR